MKRLFLYFILVLSQANSAEAYQIRDGEGKLRRGSQNVINTVPGQGEYIDAIHRFDERNIGLLNIASPTGYYGKELANCSGGQIVQQILRKGKNDSARQSRSYYVLPPERAFTVSEEKVQSIVSQTNLCADGAVRALQADIQRAKSEVDRAKGVFELKYRELYLGAKKVRELGERINFDKCEGKDIKETGFSVRLYVQDAVQGYVERYEALISIFDKKRGALVQSEKMLSSRGGTGCGPQ